MVTALERGERAKYEERSTGLFWGVSQPKLSLILAGMTRDLNDLVFSVLNYVACN